MKKRSSKPKKQTTNEWTELDRPQRAELVPWREMKEMGLILDVNSGDYFEINETALLIWKKLDGRNSIGSISAMLEKTYDVTKNEALSHIKQFLNIMAKAKLIYA